MLAVELRKCGPAPSGAELGDRIAALCAQITLSEHALLTILREFEASNEWVQQGALSCAQWLSWRVGMGPEASRERIRVAKALGTLGKIDEAFGAARISYSKVWALTRVATAENEELLLEIARGTTAAQLERICRKFRGYLQDEQPAAAELKRRVSVRYGDDGTMRFSIVVAESSQPPVSAQSLQTPPNFIETAGGGAVSTQTARRLCCDASVHAVVEDGEGQVLNVGRKRRTVPPAITRALEAQSGRVCSFPGCTHTLFLDRHHIQHWANGGSTSLDNLCQLCRHHHTFVHEYGWRIEKVGPKVYFYRPDGLPVKDAPNMTPLSAGTLEALADPRPAEIDELSLATTGWGEPVDMVQVIDALIHQTLQERDARASDPEA